MQKPQCRPAPHNIDSDLRSLVGRKGIDKLAHMRGVIGFSVAGVQALAAPIKKAGLKCISYV